MSREQKAGRATGSAHAGRRDAAGLILRRVARGFFRTAAPDAAAGQTFYALLSIVPTLIAVFSLISLAGDKDDGMRAALDAAREMLPPDVYAGIDGPLQEAATAAGSGWVLVSALAIALWSVARYVTALGRAINRIYGVPEGRMPWKAKPVHLLVTAAVFALVSAAGGVAALSWPLVQTLGRTFGVGDLALQTWRFARWPVLVLLVVLIIAILYYFAPNIAHAHFRLVSVGAIIAVAVFAVASAGLGFYVSNFADCDRIYGSFAGVIIFLLWLWIGNMALLLGALFDAELERVRELRAGIPAERDLQVALRDTERIERAAARDVEEEQAARRLRRSRR
ncbi:YihY/virulence factor BrkB family protein [Microbacterium esteraromaticum]|uniref:YihY/virulence factor BrkB family protein n=1 Tax=Microbacterium esteraromaticum TaxID=57043 RepID=UPI003C2E3189